MSRASTEDGSLGYKAPTDIGLIVNPSITGTKISNLDRDRFKEENREAIEDTKDLRSNRTKPFFHDVG